MVTSIWYICMKEDIEQHKQYMVTSIWYICMKEDIEQHKQYMVTSIWYICMKEDIECTKTIYGDFHLVYMHERRYRTT